MYAKAVRFGLLVLVTSAWLSVAHSQTIAQPQAAVVYGQPPSPTGGLYLSSWWDPDGSSSDEYIWDNFTLGSTQTITETDWMGGYDPLSFGSGGPVLDFVVAFYPSIPAGTQPDILNPLVQYHTGGNAGETPAGTLGGVAMYDYHFILPAPFQAAAGTKYWVQIYAYQHGSPDWGLTHGAGGDGWHFRRWHAGAGDWYQIVPGDTAFTLLGPTVPISGLSAMNDSPTALGQVTTFTATVSAGSGVSYVWDLGDQTTASGQVVTHTYVAIGSYTAAVTASNSINALTATTAVTIVGANVPIGGLAAVNDSPTRWGQPTTLTATVAAGTGVVYTWDLGDGQAGQGRVLTHTYSLGVYTAVVTASNNINTLAATTVVTVTAPYQVYLPLVCRSQ